MLQAFFGGWVVLALFTFPLLWGIVVKARQWDKALFEQLKDIKELEDWTLKAFIFIDTRNIQADVKNRMWKLVI